MFVEIFQNSSLVEILALTLLHSVWQIALVTFSLFLTLKFISKANANLRYGLAISALFLSLMLAAITFIYVSQFPTQSSINQIVSAKDSDRIFQEQIENSEVISANGKAVSDAKTQEKTNAIGTLQNNFGEYFSAYSSFLVAFWFIGMLFFSLRLFGGFWQLHRFKTQEVSDVENLWKKRFSTLCEKLEVKQKVKILQSNLIETPMIIGWIKPVILVPASVFLQMNPTQLETIIAHELMHIKRFDYLVNVAQSFVEILFFYHPCIWWISAKIRQERECACDDAVLQTLENAQFTYANALANLEEFRQTAKQNEPQLNVAANGGKLMNRIERIVKKETKKSSMQNSLWSASLASMLILAFFVTIFWANSSSDVNQKTTWNYNSERKMAIGFVSIPPGVRRADKSFDETLKLLIEKLKKNEIPAIGFLEGSRTANGKYKDSKLVGYELNKSKMNLVRMWRDAGFELGVGGYKHMRFYDVDYESYTKNTAVNLKTIQDIFKNDDRQIKFFSYPYLNTGKNLQDKSRFEDWLTVNSLRFVPYTFDNQEWMYSHAYDVARRMGRDGVKAQIKRDFLEYMKKMVVLYEAYSNDLFGREIPQTLVLTSSRLVADSADELFGIFRNRGYEFVPMEEALSDVAFLQPDTYVGRAGISWLERWTLTRGGKLRKEPKVDNDVDKIWREMNIIKDANKPPSPPPPPNAERFIPAPAPPTPPKVPKNLTRTILSGDLLLAPPINTDAPKAPNAPPAPPIVD